MAQTQVAAQEAAAQAAAAAAAAQGSDAAAAAAAGAAAALGILVNPSNYLIGNHRGLTVEMATDVVAQQRAIVATRRFGFIAKEAGAAGKASMALLLTAAS